MANWGTSLHASNVQEFANAKWSERKILDRYTRHAAEPELVGGLESDRLPVIDFELLMDPKLCPEELAKLDRACSEWGFFQVINHGVSEELIEKVKNDVRGFFELPLDEKEEYAQLADGIEGYGHSFVTSEEQKLDWGDSLVFFTQPPTKRSMRFWPTNPPTFRETIDNYSSELKRVVSGLFKSLDKNLGLEEEGDCLVIIFKNNIQAIRFHIYPPCPESSKVLCHSPHSDADGLTLLLQVNNINGLQIRKDGKWFAIKPLPYAFIVNIGDLVEIFSNGKYKSIEHRVVIDPQKERFSIAAFTSPDDSTCIGPLPKLVNGIDSEVRYKSVRHGEYMKAFFAARLNGKNLLESMKINK